MLTNDRMDYHPHEYPRGAFNQSGLTLLEIMITVVILSLGLLGLAGLQITGLKNNRDAYYNSLASHVAQDITERLRVDSATRNAVVMTTDAGTGVMTSTVKVLEGNNNQCASAIAYSFDSRVACLASNLPLGRVRIAGQSASPKAFYVAVLWNDPQLDGANGWIGVDTDPVVHACGVAVADTRCYYNVFMP